MKAIGFSQYLPLSHDQALQELNLPVPPLPQGHDLLVQVKAISVNPVDVKVRVGKTSGGVQPEEPRVIGWDASGTVTAVGPEVSGFKVGDEVYYAGDLQRSGSNAEYQLVDERLVALKPESWSFAEAAAVPLTALTAWEGLFEGLGINIPQDSGKKLLVVGGAGGVPSMVVQLARWAGLRVFGTASRPESEAWLRQLGAAAVLDHSQELAPQWEQLGEGDLDYIFCTSHTEQHWQSMARMLRPHGAAVLIDGATDVPLGAFKSKSLKVAWELMFTRSAYQTADMREQQRILQRVAALADAGLLTSTLTTELRPISVPTMRQAHEMVESQRMVGKVVVEGWQ